MSFTTVYILDCCHWGPREATGVDGRITGAVVNKKITSVLVHQKHLFCTHILFATSKRQKKNYIKIFKLD